METNDMMFEKVTHKSNKAYVLLHVGKFSEFPDKKRRGMLRASAEKEKTGVVFGSDGTQMLGTLMRQLFGTEDPIDAIIAVLESGNCPFITVCDVEKAVYNERKFEKVPSLKTFMEKVCLEMGARFEDCRLVTTSGVPVETEDVWERAIPPDAILLLTPPNNRIPFVPF